MSMRKIKKLKLKNKNDSKVKYNKSNIKDDNNDTEPRINLAKLKNSKIKEQVKKVIDSTDTSKLTPDNPEYVSKVKYKLESITQNIFTGSLTNVNSNSYIAILKYMLAMLIDMLPQAEEDYYDKRKSPYNVLNITRSIKEITESLQEFEDNNSYQKIDNDIIKPKLQDLIQFFIVEMDNTRLHIKEDLKLNKSDLNKLNQLYSDSLRNIKIYMIDFYKAINQSFKEFYDLK